MCLEVLHLLLVHIQEKLHALGHVIEALQLAVAIGEDFTGTVVTSHDHITTIGVDDVVSSVSGIA